MLQCHSVMEAERGTVGFWFRRMPSCFNVGFFFWEIWARFASGLSELALGHVFYAQPCLCLDLRTIWSSFGLTRFIFGGSIDYFRHVAFHLLWRRGSIGPGAYAAARGGGSPRMGRRDCS